MEHSTQSQDEIAQKLPTLTLNDIRQLLESTQAEIIQQGIYAVGALQAVPLLEPIAQLRYHADEVIAEMATDVFVQLIPLALEIGVPPLVAKKAKRSDHSVLFPRLGDAQQRRQILRWLMHDYKEANEPILVVLRSALEDEDWEVRATAMLAAARLKAEVLGKLIRRVELPRTGHEGLDQADRQILLAVRQAVLLLLAGKVPLPQTDTLPITHEAVQTHLLRCVAGLPVNWHDRIFLLVEALTQPLRLEDPPQPPRLPIGIIEAQGQYRLAKTGIKLVWVPPIPHWLGEDFERPAVANPIRRVYPSTGFFIFQQPITQALVRRIEPSLSVNRGSAHNAAYFACSWVEAQRFCNLLSQRENLPISLPSADEWEMTARGTDGRRFPWGNGLEHDMLQLASPWGGLDMIGIISQWTSTLSESGEPIICGGEDQLNCAMRTIANRETTKAGLRLVTILKREHSVIKKGGDSPRKRVE